MAGKTKSFTVYVRRLLSFTAYVRPNIQINGYTRNVINMNGYLADSYVAPIALPEIVTAPVVSGEATLGSLLTCSTGIWLNSPSEYQYQWRRNGVDISGKNSNTYTSVSDDVGTDIDCVVTATNTSGSTDQDSNDITVTAIMITGMRILFDPNPSWVGLQALAIVKTDGTNIMPSTRVAPSNANRDFDDLQPGEYTSDSAYSSTVNALFHVWSNTGVHWNSGVGSDMNVYLKFPAAVRLDEISNIQISLRNSNTYNVPALSFFREDGTVIPILAQPTDKDDRNGDSTIDGVTTANSHIYKFTLQ